MKRFLMLFTCIFCCRLAFAFIGMQDTTISSPDEDTAFYSKQEDDQSAFSTNDSSVVRQFLPGFKQKYSDESFNYKELEKDTSAFQKFLDQLFQAPAATPKDHSFSIFWVYLFYFIIALALMYGVYVLVSVLLGKKGPWLIHKKSDGEVLFYGDENDMHSDIDYKSLITKSLEQNDFRSAVRYQYLFLLIKLAKKGIVTLHKEKTNSDYRNEIKDKNLGQSFSYVSYIYNCTWYGEFVMTQTEYEQASGAFEETNNMI
ncbi:MAG: hypothetical protein H7X99_01900 [Saprospiraceae bacterium]|nr:hypothetical protein [Saprospiraceae bacterium]